MPDKISEAVKYMNGLPPEFAGVLMAMFMSILRVVYDEDETRWMRTVLESVICGAITLSINSGIIALGLGQNWAVFVGGTVGYFGTAKVRMFALFLLTNKLGIKPKDHHKGPKDEK